ncbi:MAG: aminotransferase class I/II-fold pyridoxal phosphate-dependent enzyme [Comamonadaceae bacterium]|nr:aminotransferase class I/II-fold pyridoxal phosphate-dependent enzyme [Comamonadaceae bacterium]
MLRRAARRCRPRSVVLLHACCHNPTGVDLTRAQWDALIPVLRERGLLPYLDLAYQGYGDGIDDDAFAVRALADAGLPFFVANSFSKSMSVYGERAGALSRGLRRRAPRPSWCSGSSRPRCAATTRARPIHAAGIVSRVLADPALRAPWEADVAAMRERILAMRAQPARACCGQARRGRDFGYFLSQRGMFSYTGLSAAQVDRLREEFGVYLVRSGRICVAGLNTGNVERTAAGDGGGAGRAAQPAAPRRASGSTRSRSQRCAGSRSLAHRPQHLHAGARQRQQLGQRPRDQPVRRRRSRRRRPAAAP